MRPEMCIRDRQSIFDLLAPGILSLALVLGLYRYYTKGTKNGILKATLMVLGVGLVLGAVGFLA